MKSFNQNIYSKHTLEEDFQITPKVKELLEVHGRYKLVFYITMTVLCGIYVLLSYSFFSGYDAKTEEMPEGFGYFMIFYPIAFLCIWVFFKYKITQHYKSNVLKPALEEYDVSYTPNSGIGKSELERSGMFGCKAHSLMFDGLEIEYHSEDLFHGEGFSFNDIDLKHEKKMGRRFQIYYSYHGSIIQIRMNFAIPGTVVVTTSHKRQNISEKLKLVDVEDGSTNEQFPFSVYSENEKTAKALLTPEMKEYLEYFCYRIANFKRIFNYEFDSHISFSFFRNNLLVYVFTDKNLFETRLFSIQWVSFNRDMKYLTMIKTLAKLLPDGKTISKSSNSQSSVTSDYRISSTKSIRRMHDGPLLKSSSVILIALTCLHYFMLNYEFENRAELSLLLVAILGFLCFKKAYYRLSHYNNYWLNFIIVIILLLINFKIMLRM